MDIVERKPHNDKIQKFLDTGKGKLILIINGEKYLEYRNHLIFSLYHKL